MLTWTGRIITTRRLTLVLAVLALTALSVAPQTAAAHSTATRTRADSFPEATSLLTQADQALVAAGTYRLVLNTTSYVPGDANRLPSTDTDHLVADIDLRHEAARMQQKRTSRYGSSTETHNARSIQIRGRTWYKSKASKNKWKKGTFTDQDLIDFGAAAQFALRAAEVGVTHLEYATVGLEQLNGVAVWHIHADYTVPNVSGGGISGTIDAYVTEQGSLPVEWKVREIDARSPPSTINEALAVYSKLGEPLSIKPPKVGSSKPLVS